MAARCWWQNKPQLTQVSYPGNTVSVAIFMGFLRSPHYMHAVRYIRSRCAPLQCLCWAWTGRGPLAWRETFALILCRFLHDVPHINRVSIVNVRGSAQLELCANRFTCNESESSGLCSVLSCESFLLENCKELVSNLQRSLFRVRTKNFRGEKDSNHLCVCGLN